MTLTLDTFPFEVAVMTGIFAAGRISFVNFAARTPRQRALEPVPFTALACILSATSGRAEDR